MLTFMSLIFLCSWMLPADIMTLPFNSPLPLSLAEESVDDMYFGCQKKMMTNVKTDYFEKEMQNEKLKKAWYKCSKEKPKEADKALTKDLMRAVCVYTSKDIYDIFNTAVRTGASDYRSSFHFHSLHFLLTSAVQILNNNDQCHTTYRRTRSVFSGNVGQTFRFGSFVSSSFKKPLKQVGSETCFKIQTCAGAYLQDYSSVDKKVEVLIPPYEVFKVTQRVLAPLPYGELPECKVVYVLESAGVRSSLNCKAVFP